jgi:hypothetical protein
MIHDFTRHVITLLCINIYMCLYTIYDRGIITFIFERDLFPIRGDIQTINKYITPHLSRYQKIMCLLLHSFIGDL